MQTVGHIEEYRCVTDNITTVEVTITDVQTQHIKGRHLGAYELLGQYFYDTVENPDYILEANNPNTALILKEAPQKGERVKLVLRSATSTDNPAYKNLIITFVKIDKKDWMRLIRNTRKSILQKERKRNIMSSELFESAEREKPRRSR